MTDSILKDLEDPDDDPDKTFVKDLSDRFISSD